MEEMKKLWADARELSLGTSGSVDRVDSPPSPLRFLRDYVSANKPCIISRSGTTTHWPAISLWTDDAYLRRSLADRTVSVHLTPDGRADSLAPLPGRPDSLCFASAGVRQMPFSHALRLISSPSDSIVAYAQQQDDCFRSEYSALSGDVDDHISWASDALGRLPEAVNLWIGGSCSETSFHKDHYENLYAVVTGEKHFLLLPPTEVHRLYIRSYPAASYTDEGEELRLEVEVPERLVPWCSVNPYPRTPEDMEKQRMSFPLYFEGPSPFECTVKAGEILYLPSMWFHHVRQTPDSNGRTIAVNYWYDMQFDMKYAYFNFLQSIELPRHNNSSQQLLENHQGYSDSQINSPGKDDDDSESEVQADSVNVDTKCSKASNRP